MTTVIFRSPYAGCCFHILNVLSSRFPDYHFSINPLLVKGMNSVEMEATQERYDELMPDVFFYVGFAFQAWLLKQPNHSEIQFYNDGFR